MKKQLGIVTLALVPAISMAAGTAIPGTTKVLSGNCSLLQDDLTITLSQNVSGAYNCNVSGGAISIAACHTGGRVSSRTAVAQTPAGCGGTASDSVACTGTTGTQVTGAVVPFASTLGGSMSSKFGGTCDAAGSTAANAI